MSLSDLVARTGVPASTVHHYLRCGLIPPPERGPANRFGYDDRHVKALGLIRVLRDKRGLGLDAIAECLPELLAAAGASAAAGESAAGWDAPGCDAAAADGEARLVAAAIRAFERRSYNEVTVSDIAEAAGVAKGSVYRHFGSKDELFTAAVEQILADTAADFSEAVGRLAGPGGLAGSPERTAGEFARLVAHALPLMLELGARASKGHEPSQQLARKVLRTLAEAAGAPLSGDDPVKAGLDVIRDAFSVVLAWAVGTDWPEDILPADIDPWEIGGRGDGG